MVLRTSVECGDVTGVEDKLMGPELGKVVECRRKGRR